MTTYPLKVLTHPIKRLAKKACQVIQTISNTSFIVEVNHKPTILSLHLSLQQVQFPPPPPKKEEEFLTSWHVFICHIYLRTYKKSECNKHKQRKSLRVLLPTLQEIEMEFQNPPPPPQQKI